MFCSGAMFCCRVVIIFDQGGRTGRCGCRANTTSGFIWMMPRMEQGRWKGFKHGEKEGPIEMAETRTEGEDRDGASGEAPSWGM